MGGGGAGEDIKTEEVNERLNSTQPGSWWTQAKVKIWQKNARKSLNVQLDSVEDKHDTVYPRTTHRLPGIFPEPPKHGPRYTLQATKTAALHPEHLP